MQRARLYNMMCDDLVMNAIATAATGMGPVKLEKKVWPNVLMRLPAADGVSTVWGGGCTFFNVTETHWS